MKTWIIHFENAHFCGGGEHILIDAETEDSAEEHANDYMNGYQYELFRDEFDEFDEFENEPAHSVISVELFNEDHEYWNFRSTITKV